jgi:hypothetical protein
LRRADGESIYRAHGDELYATRAQLSMEEQLIADAQADTAPHLAREQAAWHLGADLARLDAQIHASAGATAAAHGHFTAGALRLDRPQVCHPSLPALRGCRRSQVLPTTSCR